MTPSGVRVATKPCRRIQACSAMSLVPTKAGTPAMGIYHIFTMTAIDGPVNAPTSRPRMTSSHCWRQEFQMHVAFGIFLDDGLAFLDFRQQFHEQRATLEDVILDRLACRSGISL